MMYDDLIYEFINEVSKELEKKLEHRNDDYDDCDWDCESCEFYDERSEADDDRVSGDDDIECDGDCENCEFNENNIIADERLIGSLSNNEYDEKMTYDAVDHPYHYTSHGMETIDKIEAVIDGLPAQQASALANVLRYFDRAGLKDNAKQDLNKANNYAHRLCTGHWRHENV